MTRAKLKLNRIFLLLLTVLIAALIGYFLPHKSSVIKEVPTLCQVVEVIDGDTIKVVLGGEVEIVRLIGIDTPEIFSRKKDSEEYKKGIVAKEFVDKRFQENNGECMVVSTRTGGYGRWIGEIFFADSDVSLNEELLNAGLATKYKK